MLPHCLPVCVCVCDESDDSPTWEYLPLIVCMRLLVVVVRHRVQKEIKLGAPDHRVQPRRGGGSGRTDQTTWTPGDRVPGGCLQDGAKPGHGRKGPKRVRADPDPG